MRMNIFHLKPLRVPSNFKTTQWAKYLLLAAGVLLFTSIQLTLVIVPIRNRMAPVEPDDAYSYILKAAEMQECFLQNCPALNDLRQQLTAPTKKQSIAWLRYREYWRAFPVYHPFHSLIMTGLHLTGLSWETSYNFIEVAGSLLISLAISYWLYRLFGAGPAGIALLLLTFTVFPNQGLHYIVPSNLALGVAILTWGLLLRQSPGSGWIVIVCTLILAGMHPIGRVYALLSVFLFLLLNAKQMKRMDWLAVGLSVLIVGTTFLLPVIVTRPELSFHTDPPPAGWTIRTGYYNNIVQAAAIATAWFNSYGGLLTAAFLIAVGLFSLSPLKQRLPVVSMAMLVGGLLFASLLQTFPRYPAEMFGRTWVFSAVFLTGLVANGIWWWAAAFLQGIHQLLQKGIQDFRDERWILSQAGWTYVFLLLGGIFLVRGTASHVIEGRYALQGALTDVLEVQNVHLSAEQPSRLRKAGCEDVLYMAEVPMNMYLSHGALECGAIYYPGVAGTPDEVHWVQDNQALGHVVTWNPTIEATTTKGGNPLAIKTGDQLEFHLPEQWSSQHVYVYLENQGRESQLEVLPLTGSKVLKRLSIPASWFGWQEIDITAHELAQGFRIEARDVPNAIFLRGIRRDAETPFHWPWDQGLTLLHQPSDPQVPAAEINFSIANLVPYPDWSLTILDDQGDTVLIQIQR